MCTSALEKDLETTDAIAAKVLQELSLKGTQKFSMKNFRSFTLNFKTVNVFPATKSTKQQYEDNIRWIVEAGRHKMVVLQGRLSFQTRHRSILNIFVPGGWLASSNLVFRPRGTPSHCVGF